MKTLSDVKLNKIVQRFLDLLSNHTHTAADVGALSFTPLWALSDKNVTINGDGAKEFAAQTIHLDLRGYDGVKIVRNRQEPIELYRLSDGTFPIYTTGCAVDWINNGQFGVQTRRYCVNDTGIEFQDCMEFDYFDDGEHSTQVRNTSLIPMEIYGIKGFRKTTKEE
jgi:hypothetical protein